MKWEIPAKTFLLGEYAALQGESALILTTAPCFTLSLAKGSGSTEIHPDSPAGRFWQQGKQGRDLNWQDPWEGRGGLGASSAQFIGAYYAKAFLESSRVDPASLLEAYYEAAWSGKGIKPSGYDVLAQTQPSGCGVFINKNQNILKSTPWPFKDLGLILLHTGKKLATHIYLADTRLPREINTLARLAEQGFSSFQEKNSQRLIKAVNDCYHALEAMSLLAPHTREMIGDLKKHPEILAMKGCGALGSDVILLLTAIEDQNATVAKLIKEGYFLLTTCPNSDYL